MRKINRIIIHCSATPPEMDIGVPEIREWHLAKKWNDIGYHFVDRRSGLIEPGRAYNVTGAHVRGRNTGSVGFCMVGGVSKLGRRGPGGKWISGKAAANFTPAQWITLRSFLITMRHVHPGVSIHGHNEFAAKACPSFDVRKYLANGMWPEREWIWGDASDGETSVSDILS